MKTAYAGIASFITKDGSEIRELLHPDRHGPGRMSFAEATVTPGATTLMHLHRASEEIYHITEGVGTMRLGDQEFAIHPGDTIRIPPGTWHNLTAAGLTSLKIICVSTPPYAHEDTQLA